MMHRLPNILTTLRLIMALVFAPIFFYELHNGTDGIWALTLYTVASFTDILDGYLARKYSAISDFGKIVDPLADKLLQFLVSLCVAFVDPIFMIVPIFLFVKEILMLVGVVILYQEKIVLGANIYGKIASFVYFLLFFILLAFRSQLPSLSLAIKIVFIAAFLIASGLAFAQYLKIYFENKKKAEQLL